MKKYQNFLSENFPFSVVKFSICLNRRVFVVVYIHQNMVVVYMIIVDQWNQTARLYEI